MTDTQRLTGKDEALIVPGRHWVPAGPLVPNAWTDVADAETPVAGGSMDVFIAGTLTGRVPLLHAGEIVRRLLAPLPDVADVDELGCEQLPDGVMSYSVGLTLADGRQLVIDVSEPA